MTAVTIPASDSNLTEGDIQLILRLSALGLKLISEGAGPNKIATVFNDIRRVSSLRIATSYEFSAQQSFPCSSCYEYLPNMTKYYTCLETCS